jgi:hypothetical protein
MQSVEDLGVQNMKFVCPLPIPWNETYQRLLKAWEAEGKKGRPPPVPLILNGWVYSNDVEKAERWQATIKWAEARGLTSLLPRLTDDEQYVVEELSGYQIGPMGGPMFLPWDFTEKEKPSKELLQETLLRLKKEWADVVGADLARVTKPIGFTGAKGRRLLVQADNSMKPPWGEWDRLAPDERRRGFTKFRQAVNDAIAPLAVDHIDFDTSEKSPS